MCVSVKKLHILWIFSEPWLCSEWVWSARGLEWAFHQWEWQVKRGPRPCQVYQHINAPVSHICKKSHITPLRKLIRRHHNVKKRKTYFMSSFLRSSEINTHINHDVKKNIFYLNSSPSLPFFSVQFHPEHQAGPEVRQIESWSPYSTYSHWDFICQKT